MYHINFVWYQLGELDIIITLLHLVPLEKYNIYIYFPF